MKDLIKNKYFIIVSILTLLIGIGIPFLINGILQCCGIINFQYPLLIALFAILYALTASLIGDLSIYIYKKKNQIVISDVPNEIKKKSSLRKYPFIVGCIGTVIVFAILFIIYKTTGRWPLL